MSFFDALRFLTVIPVPWQRESSAERLGQSVSFFPLVGAVVGLILAGLDWLLVLVLPTAIVNVLLVVSLVVISGALHLDGVVDTCDGLAGHRTPEERLKIMRDSRAGGFGVIGAILVVLVKYVSLSSVPVALMIPALLVMPVFSRWAMAYAIVAYPYARPSGLGTAFKQGASSRRLTIATAITIVLTLGLTYLANIAQFYLVVLALILGVWIVAIMIASYLKSKLTGLTGDSYGAINELAEVTVLILVSLLAHNHWLRVV